MGHSNSKERKVIQLIRKESLHKVQESKPQPATLLLGLGQGKHSELGGRGVGGREGEGQGRGGSGGQQHRWRETRGGDANVGGEPF